MNPEVSRLLERALCLPRADLLEFLSRLNGERLSRIEPASDKDEAIRKLTGNIDALGIRDSEGWAESEVKEGLPQYEALVFLCTLWTYVRKRGDLSWIDRLLSSPECPEAKVLKRLLESGADRHDLGDFSRSIEASLLCGLVYLLDDYGAFNYPRADMPRVRWGLYVEDETGQPTVRLSCLHELVHDTDPVNRKSPSE